MLQFDNFSGNLFHSFTESSVAKGFVSGSWLRQQLFSSQTLGSRGSILLQNTRHVSSADPSTALNHKCD